jgi:hypothetical protein
MSEADDKRFWRAMRRKLKQRTCAYCGQRFLAGRKDARFCSLACSRRYHRDKAKQGRQEKSEMPMKTEVEAYKAALKWEDDKAAAEIKARYIEQMGLLIHAGTAAADWEWYVENFPASVD